METYQVRRGRRLALRVTLCDATGQVVTAYAGTETLGLDLWLGDDLAGATLATSAATWADGPNGLVDVVLTSADTAGLSALIYRLALTITVGGETVDAWAALIEVQPAAAAGAALATGPATFEDLHRLEPRLREFVLEDPEQRSDLSEYLNAGWVRCYRRAILGRLRRRLERYHANYLQPDRGDPVIPDGYGWTEQDKEDRLDALMAFVDDGTSLQTSDGEAAEIVARDALARLLGAQIGQGDAATAWQARAAAHAARRDSLLAGHIARIDVGDADGRLVVLEA